MNKVVIVTDQDGKILGVFKDINLANASMELTCSTCDEHGFSAPDTYTYRDHPFHGQKHMKVTLFDVLDQVDHL